MVGCATHAWQPPARIEGRWAACAPLPDELLDRLQLHGFDKHGPGAVLGAGRARLDAQREAAGAQDLLGVSFGVFLVTGI